MGGNGSYGMMGSYGEGIASHIEGRIAFLKTELKITEAQTAAWNRFADALRASSKSTGAVIQTMQAACLSPNPVSRLDAQTSIFQSRLDALKQLKATLEPLFNSFSEEQKRVANELALVPMGMMPMGMGMM